MNKVQIIADSKSPQRQRLITAILTFPRYLLAEVNTHRMLSRNSASSRAIRFEKMVQSVMENPFIPFRWQKDHPGMQGTEYFSPEETISQTSTVKTVEMLKRHWLIARDNAVRQAQILHGDGVTKQIVNRLLEPFMYHTALVSGTDLENFFALRADDAAEIHFQDLAYKFLDACNESEPKQLKAGEWHIPFGDDMDWNWLASKAAEMLGWSTILPPSNRIEDKLKFDAIIQGLRVKIATVRAARISYALPGTEQKHDYEADLKLHDRLASSGHWSAFEHCARAMSEQEFELNVNGKLEWTGGQYDKPLPVEGSDGWCGNFRGFIQYRKMFDNENRTDSRLIKK